MSGKNSCLFILLLLALLQPGWRGGAALAGEVSPIRLVALVNLDDQGELIEFPRFLFYDYWGSETYLLSSNNRVTVYDHKYFPVASFGLGRGLLAPEGLAVDRHGLIYVCQSADATSGKSPRLTIYNQAFFIIKEIFFAQVPELVDFIAHRVAVAESGEIYLSGLFPNNLLQGVAVLTAEGQFLRFLRPPEKDGWQDAPVAPPVGDQGAEEVGLPGATPGPGAEAVGEGNELPAGLKPKSSTRVTEDMEEKGHATWATIVDVKIDRQGRIYLLSREAGHIYVLNAREEYLFKFGEKGGADGKLSNPLSLGIDLERRVIYVCDYMRHTILAYDYDSGRYIFEFGGQGISPLWFDFPNSIEVDQRGRVVVSDLFNRRLQVIDPILRIPPTPALPGQALSPPAAVPELENTALPSSAPPDPALAPPAAVSELENPALPTSAPPDQALSVPAAVPGPELSALPLLPPIPPVLAAGSGLPAVRGPSLTPLSPPADRLLPLAPRELAPRRLKKAAPPRRPVLEPVTVVPLRSPRLMSRPGPVSFPKEKRVSRTLATPAEALWVRLRALPTAVGAYGPVAVILGVGGQLLITNR